MKNRRQYERIGLGAIVALLLLFLIPAVFGARASVRDNLRKDDLTNVKRALELYFNANELYVPPPAGSQSSACTSSDDPDSWLFGAGSPLVEGRFIDAVPHDVREGRGRSYRYCVTDDQVAGQGFFLEAQLEGSEPEVIGFDEDEGRKFFYRTLRSDGNTLYRICGGTEMQCR